MSNLITQKGYDFSFDSSACDSCGGKCCIGESGYIWINIAETIALSNHLKMQVEEFEEKYVYKVGYKYSLKEVKLEGNSFACCFFDLKTKKCSVYDYRPTQCRTFPFWEHFKKNKNEVYKECPATKNIL